MDDTKVISDESGRPSLPALRIRHVAPFSIYPEVDKPDEEDEDSSGEVKSVESSIVDETGSGDSAPSVAEEKYHERDDPHEEKPESPNADLRELESSSPSSAEAKLDHSDGEAKDITEMVDERDEECNEDNSGKITAVESSTMSKPRSSDSGSCIDDPELHVGESSPPSPEAKGDHPDGEDEDNTETPGLRSNASSAEPPSTRSANQKNDTLANRMPSRDISTMKMAIRSGDPKAVNDLLERLSDTLAMDELTTAYGGRRFWEADEDGLFMNTSPILHAARSGNLAVFESVMKAMRAKLSQEQVKKMLAKKDYAKQSLLSLAALSGSKNVLEGVLLVIQNEFAKSKVKRPLASRNRTQGKKQARAFQRAFTPLPRRTRGVTTDRLVLG